jgi:hypothetical protein
MSESEDRQRQKMIVRATMGGETIHHRASRGVRHISIIICITAAGESLMPHIVISQNSDAIRKRLMNRRVYVGVGFVLRHRSKPHVSGKLFLEYINAIFVAYLNELRDSKESEASEAVVVMDNYSPHISDDFVAILTSVRVRIITLAPHTTHVFRVLDVVLFCALKKHATGLEKLDEEQ